MPPSRLPLCVEARPPPSPAVSIPPPSTPVTIYIDDKEASVDIGLICTRSGYAEGCIHGGFSAVESLHLATPPFTPKLFDAYIQHVHTRTLPPSIAVKELVALYAAGEFMADDVVCLDILNYLYEKMHAYRCTCHACLVSIPVLFKWSHRDGVVSVETGIHHILFHGWSVILGTEPTVWLSLPEETRDALLVDITDTIAPETCLSILHSVLSAREKLDVHPTIRNVDRDQVVTLSLDVIQDACESMVKAHLANVLRGSELASMLTGWDRRDTVSHVFTFISSNLNDSNAVVVWEACLANVLGSMGAGSLEVRELKSSVVAYLKKRWPSIVAAGGFDGMYKEKLDMVSEDIGVAADDLVIPEDRRIKTRTGLKVGRIHDGSQGSSIGVGAMHNEEERRGTTKPPSRQTLQGHASSVASSLANGVQAHARTPTKWTLSHPRFHVNMRVELNDGRTGVIRFIGPTEFAVGDWVGVELDDPHIGKNDGSVHGVRYFKTLDTAILRGVFVREQTMKRRM